MHFQVFIPYSGSVDTKASPLVRLEQVGLVNLSQNASQQPIKIGPTVDGIALGPGDLFTWSVKSASYFGANADWIPAAPAKDAEGNDLAAGRYWIGIHKNSKPTPTELKRVDNFPGPKVVLGDGNEWMIAAGGRLPHVYKLNSQGEYESKVREEFQDYFEKTTEWYHRLLLIDPSQETVSVTVGWCQCCIEAIGMNYRMPAELASYLELIGSDNLWSIAMASVEGLEIKMVEEDFKKKE